VGVGAHREGGEREVSMSIGGASAFEELSKQQQQQQQQPDKSQPTP
jgi:hypothetical protein